jgi:hypothetical protein
MVLSSATFYQPRNSPSALGVRGMHKCGRAAGCDARRSFGSALLSTVTPIALPFPWTFIRPPLSVVLIARPPPELTEAKPMLREPLAYTVVSMAVPP